MGVLGVEAVIGTCAPVITIHFFSLEDLRAGL